MPEGFDILKRPISLPCPRTHRFDLDIADIAEVWRRARVLPSGAGHGPLRHWRRTTPGYYRLCGRFRGSRWTVNDAIDEAVPAEVLTARCLALPFAQGAQFCGKDVLPRCATVSAATAERQEVIQRQRHMTVTQAKQKQREPCRIVIFGVSGDLAPTAGDPGTL